jgi:WD40 repeat protein
LFILFSFTAFEFLTVSFSGDIKIWNTSSNEMVSSFDGVGKGGTVTWIKFHPLEAESLVSTSVDGVLKITNLMDGKQHSYLKTLDWNWWYTAVDISSQSGEAKKKKEILITNFTESIQQPLQEIFLSATTKEVCVK